MLLYLASSSPRRRALLADAGLRFEVVHPGPEIPGDGPPRALALARATSKALGAALADRPPGLVLGVDTVVALQDVEYDTPRSEAELRRCLTALSGHVHDVFTAHCLRSHPLRAGEVWTAVAHARVRFATLDPARIERHVAGRLWVGKAGGYGIQDESVDFASLEDGELDTVIGLSIDALRGLLVRSRETERG